MRLRFNAVIGAFFLAGSAACISTDTNPSLDQFGKGVSIPRTFAPRLSVRTHFNSCPSSHARRPIDGMACDSPAELPPTAVLQSASTATRRLEQQFDPHDLHAVAVSDLVWGNSEGKTLDRSISFLNMAAHSGYSARAAALSDLSAAFLLRAQRSQDVRDLFQAVEVADSSIALDRDAHEPHFNLALALEALGLDRQAIAEWKRYIALDANSEWSKEARARLNDLATTSTQPPRVPTDLGPDALVQFAAKYPQEARVYGWEVLLGSWAKNVLSQKDSEAATSLAQAKILGNELVRARRDATLNRAITSIEAVAHDRVSRERLARAHRVFAESRIPYRGGDYAAASALLKLTLANAVDSKSLRDWATLFYAATIVYDGNPVRGHAMMAHVAETADRESPALSAQAQWMLGTTDMRRGLYEKGLREFGIATHLFDLAGERENEGITTELAADAQLHLGDINTAYTTGLEALRLLEPYHSSVWIHNLLAVIASSAASDGFGDAALRIQTEGLTAAEAFGKSIYIAEAHLARARIGVQTARRESTAADLDTAETLIKLMPDGAASRWFHADLLLTRTQAQPSGTRAVYRTRLDSAVEVFSQLKNNIRLVPALLVRADAELDASDFVKARSDMSRAIDILRGEHDAISSAALRQSTMVVVRDVFQRAAVLAAAAGDTIAALKHLDQSRATLVRGLPASPEKTIRLPRGIVGIEYLARADTLLAWVVREDRVQFVRTSLSGFNLGDSVNRVVTLLELGNSAGSNILLQSLYARLISPLATFLNRDDRLVFVGDDWIATTPFAALRNSDTGRYLIQDHAVSFSDQLPMRERSRLRPELEILLIGNPEPNARREVQLRPIPGSQGEVDSINSLYSNAISLTGKDATTEATLSALHDASVFHFAGHAVIDAMRPMQSYLAVSTSKSDTAGELTAGAIADLRLPHLRLAVLSACETARPTRANGLAMNGLMLAFLSAGADGAIGTLWRVEDDPTGALMIDFYRNLKKTGDPASALRLAQLNALPSSGSHLARPTTWAAFQYWSN
jgi:CHAT domain-containing protein